MRASTTWFVTSFLHTAADLLLGASCPGCGAAWFGVCAECRKALDLPVRPVHRGLPVPLYAASPYRPILARVVPRYKDDGALHLDRVLGGLLTRAITALDPQPGTIVVPVPSRPAAIRARGYDHAYRLARIAAREMGLTAQRVARRLPSGSDQEGLTRQERAENLFSSMRARPMNARALVVDDVVTTGASLRETIECLRVAGVHVLGAAVVADADYR